MYQLTIMIRMLKIAKIISKISVHIFKNKVSLVFKFLFYDPWIPIWILHYSWNKKKVIYSNQKRKIATLSFFPTSKASSILNKTFSPEYIFRETEISSCETYGKTSNNLPAHGTKNRKSRNTFFTKKKKSCKL